MIGVKTNLAVAVLWLLAASVHTQEQERLSNEFMSQLEQYLRTKLDGERQASEDTEINNQNQEQEKDEEREVENEIEVDAKQEREEEEKEPNELGQKGWSSFSHHARKLDRLSAMLDDLRVELFLAEVSHLLPIRGNKQNA